MRAGEGGPVGVLSEAYLPARMDEIRAALQPLIGARGGVTGMVSTGVLGPSDVIELLDEIERLRQGLWDIYRILGGDTDDDETPRALVSDIVPPVIEAATEVREELDRVWRENCGCL